MTVSTTPDTDTQTDTAASESGSSLPRMGEVLRDKREEKGLSIEDVSNRLRLSPRQIQALESNQFAVFPEPMMTRGFIRNYAGFLEIDAAPLLAAYRQHVPEESPHSISIHSANVQLPGYKQRSWGRYVFWLFFIAALAAGWVGYTEYVLHRAPVPDAAPVAEKTTETPASSEPMPQAALPLAERAANEEAAAQTTDNAAGTPATSTSSPAATVAVSEPAAATAADQGKPDVKLKPDSAAGAKLLKLKFVFNEESWVSVTENDGHQVFNRSRPAGAEVEVEAKPPVKVVIGNAVGTQVIFQGKAIDLVPYTRLNVARLKLAIE